MTPRQRQQLIDLAVAVRQRAYAPYSHFQVGAAVLTESGAMYSGCNVENASYGLTICAERAAISQAVAAGDRRLLALVVAATGRVAPCGACRQVIAEFADDLPVLLLDPAEAGAIIEIRLNELLPFRFRLDREGRP